MILFLLFGLALYEFITAGFPVFAVICLLPVVVLAVIISFRKGMLVFWTLMLINYFIQWKSFPVQGIPTSLPNEALELLLLAMALINVHEYKFSRCLNLMLGCIIVWCLFCTLEIFNDTCGLGMQAGAWYGGARLMAYQLLYIFLIYTIYINKPKLLIQYLYFWGILSIFAAFWVWKQQHLGMTQAETSFLMGRGRTTHVINGGTTIRLFSVFCDAANFGINMAATATAFIIFGIKTKVKKHRKFFLATGLICAWAMFPSGTRTAIVCLFAGLGTFVFLSKSVKIAVPVTIVFALAFFMLAFTNIGQGNAQIRRMRSAFDKNDASSNQRAINQETMRKYLGEAPWGIGLGMGFDNVPANNKFRKMATIAPDSEYVFIWIRTGRYGLTTFLITTAILMFGACWITVFRIKNNTLQGIAAGLCSAFASIQLGGYGNQVLMQFPNCMLFYGGMALVYALPLMEKDWEVYENEKLAEEEEKRRLKLEKKNAKRV